MLRVCLKSNHSIMKDTASKKPTRQIDIYLDYYFVAKLKQHPLCNVQPKPTTCKPQCAAPNVRQPCLSETNTGLAAVEIEKLLLVSKFRSHQLAPTADIVSYTNIAQNGSDGIYIYTGGIPIARATLACAVAHRLPRAYLPFLLGGIWITAVIFLLAVTCHKAKLGPPRVTTGGGVRRHQLQCPITSVSRHRGLFQRKHAGSGGAAHPRQVRELRDGHRSAGARLVFVGGCRAARVLVGAVVIAAIVVAAVGGDVKLGHVIFAAGE